FFLGYSSLKKFAVAVLCQTFLPKLASKINCDKTRIYLFPVPKERESNKVLLFLLLLFGSFTIIKLQTYTFILMFWKLILVSIRVAYICHPTFQKY
ncbi:MAG: hypothetical protein ACI81T_001755, partial [Bacteroidia bacterium]